MILSAGAVNSPHILQLSGVGAPEHLNRIGIPVRHALTGGRQELQDHYVARVSYPVSGAPTVNERSRGLALAGEIVRYLVTGKGMLTYSASLAAASVKVLEESATPDVQCSIAPGSFKDGQIGELDDFPGITAGAWQMRPLSRGYVEAKSSDPREAPAINPRYLSEQTDRSAIIGGLRFVRRLFAAPALAKYCRRRNPAWCPYRERRRAFGLRTAEGLDRLSRDLHLQDGQRSNGGGRRSAAGPWARRTACHRCFGDAHCHLDQH